MIYNGVNEGGLNALLARRLQVQSGAPAPACAPEIFPNLTLENDRPEWSYLKGEVLCQRHVAANAVAGQYSAIQLYLPATANALVVVTSIVHRALGTLTFGRAQGIGAGLGGWGAYNTATRDFRWPANRTQGIMEITANVAIPSLNFALGILPGGESLLEPIVIVPNTSLCLYTQAVATGLSLDIAWYERPALPGELG